MDILFVQMIAFVALIYSVNSLDFNLPETSLNKCDQCKTVVNSFQEGLKRTARGKHEGGDAHWEESKLKNYAYSEVRFVDIQDHLCNDAPSAKDQCFSFAEEYENDIEDWFLTTFRSEVENANKNGNGNGNENGNKEKDEGSSLLRHLCFDVSKSCCEAGHFGPNCERCSGYPDNVCHSRGICQGNGTRSGTGACQCFAGYSGKHCEKCGKKYLATGEVESTLEGQTTKIPEKCTRCDRSCEGSCTGPGPKGCQVCAKGFVWDEEFGCADVDECSRVEVNPCSNQKYCVNTVGSYECFRCNSACLKCSGPGSDSCLECAEGYRKSGKSCVKPGDSLPKIVFIIPILLAGVIFIRFNFFYASSFVIVYALAIKVFEDYILTIA